MDQQSPPQPAVNRNEFVRSLSTGLRVLESFSAVEPRLTPSVQVSRSFDRLTRSPRPVEKMV